MEDIKNIIDREQLEQILRAHFDAYEVCFLKEQGRKYEASERDLYGLTFREEDGIALRAVKGDRMVFAYTYEKGDRAAASLVEQAQPLVPFMDADEHLGFPEKPGVYPAFQAHDATGLMTPDTEKIARVMRLEEVIRDFDSRITTTRNCELQEVEIAATIFNSRGLLAQGVKTIYTLGGLCVAANGEEVSWYDWNWSHALAELEPEALGRQIAGKAISFLDGTIIKTGVYDGLLTPGAACDMLSIVAPSFLSENLYKKKTWLQDRAGTLCFAECLNITDSGLAGMGSFPFDGEGVPSQETPLVRAGYFQGFLYDVYYGRRFGKASTANGVRGGVKEPPKCAPRGLFIEQSPHDVAGSFQDGIIIEELMGTHTANAVTGDFSLGALGYLCKGGEKKPFKGVIFSGNIFELLKNVRAVGSDLTFYGGFGSPTIFVEGLKISGT